MIDRILMGVGTSRGRKSNTSLMINDVIGFWRVENLAEDERVLLRAEMKLPGRAWLEFRIDNKNNQNVLSVTAFFCCVLTLTPCALAAIQLFATGGVVSRWNIFKPGWGVYRRWQSRFQRILYINLHCQKADMKY